MAQRLRVLVTGATGNQGGAVAGRLLERGHAVRAFVRDPASARARALAARGVELAAGDYDDPASLRRAAAGVDAAFALATPFEAGTDAEARHGVAMVDAFAQERVPLVVYSSVASADRHTGIPHFESKRRIEVHLARSGLAHIVVAPTNFRENYLGDPAVAAGVLAMPLPPSRSLQTVTLAELGAFVTLAMEQPTRLSGHRVDLASDATTGPQMAAAIGAARGREMRYEQVELDPAVDDDMSRMWRWFERVGYRADVARLRREYPEVPWVTYAEWARAQAWDDER